MSEAAIFYLVCQKKDFPGFVSYMCYLNVSCVLLLNALSCTDDPVPLPLGVVPDCHQWDAGAAEPREAVLCLQRLPEPLPRDGRRPQRLCQGAAAGRSIPDRLTHVNILAMHVQAAHTRFKIK